MTAWQELATIRHKNLSQDIERLQWNQDTASEYSDDEDPKQGLTKSALEAPFLFTFCFEPEHT